MRVVVTLRRIAGKDQGAQCSGVPAPDGGLPAGTLAVVQGTLTGALTIGVGGPDRPAPACAGWVGSAIAAPLLLPELPLELPPELPEPEAQPELLPEPEAAPELLPPEDPPGVVQPLEPPQALSKATASSRDAARIMCPSLVRYV